jgi:tetratricopeptide (TPR) repeat protein
LRTLARVVVLALAGAALALGGLQGWAWYHFREAGRLEGRQQFSRAHAEYARSLQVWRWSASTHLLAGRAARRAGLYPEAEWHLAECQRLQGGSPDPSVPLALERLLLQAQSGDLDEVEGVLWDASARQGPEAPLILEALARGYLRMLRLGMAQSCVEKLLQREPDNVEALVIRGWIREGGGDSALAARDYRRALDLDPEREDVRLSLARLLARDKPEEARGHFEYLVARQPDNPDVMLGLAQTYRALGQPDKARPLLEALLAKDPGNSRGLTELAALTAADRTAETEALLRKAIAADPANKDAHYQLYLCLAQQPGREAEAAAELATHKRVVADLTRLAEIVGKEMTARPNDPNLPCELGVIYLRYGMADQGVRWLHRALKLDPTHQPSHQTLYDYCMKTGDLDEAEKHRLRLRPALRVGERGASAP